MSILLLAKLYRILSKAKFEGYTQQNAFAAQLQWSCIGYYRKPNLKDIHNGVWRLVLPHLLYRILSKAKFEGYTQQAISILFSLIGCIGYYRKPNLKDIHNYCPALLVIT